MGFISVFTAAIGLLALLIAAAFALPAPWHWLVGLAWLTYDTWLQAHHLSRGTLAITSPRPVVIADRVPSIGVLIAAHDEAEVIRDSLASIIVGPHDRILVIDDGSSDGTAEVVVTTYGLVWEDDGGVRLAQRAGCPVTLLRQTRGGKARALNRGLAMLQTDVVVTVDADTRLDDGAVAAIRSAFADPHLTAGCGIITPTCRGGVLAGIFAFFQAREYARAFVWRAGWSADGMLLLVSGAFAAYRRDMLAAAGGFDAESLVEDYEVMYRLNQLHPGLRCEVIAGARALTDAPAAPRAFLRQRARWFGGFLATLWQHRAMVGNPRYGALGRWHLRLKTLDSVLPIYGLVAFIALVATWILRGTPHPLVLAAIAGKIMVDAMLHVRAEAVHHAWLGLPRVRPIALIASLAEQIAFQPLRQLGAVCGWLVFVRRTARGGMW